MTPRLSAFAAFAALILAGCGDRAAPVARSSTGAPAAENEVAVIATTEGDMTLAFRSDKAPGTVENFKKLARAGFYDGTAFHRIMRGFMIQGGDPLTKEPHLRHRWGSGGPGYTIKAEFNDLHHGRGVISMARSNDPDSAGSQFFICDEKAGFLDGKYTAFGRIVKGDEVLEKILSTPVTYSAQGENSSPTRRIEIKSVTILPAGDAK